MKFAKVFQQLLDEENIPKEWVNTAIQYKALKKCINKVVEELEELGLEKDTLQLLLAYEKAQRSHTYSSSIDKRRPKLIYSFEGSLHEFVPKITINLDSVKGTPLSAEISPETRAKLEHLAHSTTRRSSQISYAANDDMDTDGNQAESLEDNEIFISDREDVPTDGCDGHTVLTNVDSDKSTKRASIDLRTLFNPAQSVIQSGGKTSVNDQPALDLESQSRYPDEIEIHLHSDSEFFHMLCSELAALDSLKQEQEKVMIDQVNEIARQLPYVSSPLQKKNDLYVWREIFRLYIDAGVFFSGLEQDAGERSAERAKEQLIWFTDQVKQMNLLDRFKMRESKAVFEEFWKLNLSLLKSTQFQSLNQTATNKILKKFDKQTALSAREVFPEFYFNSPSGGSGSIAKSVCFTMAEQLLTIIPQLDDYVCPVCYLIAFKPVRLDCGHVFCIRCLVKLQRQHKDSCPICRQNVLLNADGANVDVALYNQLLLYFPKEVKAKQSANEREITEEQLALTLHGQKKCSIM
ncbi:SPX domain-containing protein [Lipomyces arxii]|uniref:SPX domain-containing protein n=1 Tax=Lipomyces arxii TaxID=56418 RepID=UPI0034D020AA